MKSQSRNNLNTLKNDSHYNFQQIKFKYSFFMLFTVNLEI